MKNTFKIFFLSAILCVAAISCSKENQPWDDAGGKKIRAGITEFGTKISINESGDNFELRWESTDKLIVENDDHVTSVFSITEGPTSDYGTGKKNAVFWGDALTGSSFTTFYSRNPGDYATFADLEDLNYSNQTQKGNGSTDHLKDYYCAYKTGQTSYSQISFNPTDANTFASSLYKFNLKLNPEFAMKIDKLTFSCDSDVFYATNGTDSICSSISMKITDLMVQTGDNTITAYMMASWQPVTIPAGSVLTVSLSGRKNSDGTTPMSYFIKFSFKTEKTLKGGAYYIDLSSRTMQKSGGTTLQGSGTSADPYLLFTADDVANMKNNIRGEGSQNMTYYKMMANIDCENVKNWTRLDDAKNYFFDFNGNGKTLSNLSIGTGQFASFFGVLEGYCYDVTFKDCSTSQSGNAGVYGCAIVASRLSRTTATTFQSYVHGIKLEGCTVTDNTACAGYSGLAFGTIVGNAKVNGISIDSNSKITMSGTSSALSYVGGVAGAICNTATTATINISNCYCAATITNNENSASGTAVGGIIGAIFKEQSVNIDNCTFSGTLASTPGSNFHGVGGILGYGATEYNSSVADGKVKITDCNCTSSITAAAKNTDGGVGGIAGLFNLGDIQRCCMTGENITVTCSAVGGIVGHAGYSTFGTHTVDSHIYDCYSTCDVDISGAGNNQFAGGIAGTVHHHTHVWRCYATGAITGKRGCGGIVGAGNDSGTEDCEIYKGNTYRANYAFNKSVSDNGGHTAKYYSNGMIIGYTTTKIRAYRCYRVNYYDNTRRENAGVTPSSLGAFTCSNVPSGCNVPPTDDNQASRPADQGVTIESSTGITDNISTSVNWIPYNSNAVQVNNNYYTAGDLAYYVNSKKTEDNTEYNVYSTSIWNLQTTSAAHGWPTLKNNGSAFTPSTTLPWTPVAVAEPTVSPTED